MRKLAAWKQTDEKLGGDLVGGQEAKFSFESDQLVLRFKSGKVVRFDRG